MPTKSNKESVKEVEAEQSVSAAKPNPKQVVFKVEKLREKCMELFGITTSTFDGAFFDNEKDKMTIDEARTQIDNWLGRKEKK